MVTKVQAHSEEGLTGAVPVQPIPEEGAERPGWLPENFKTPEDMLKSYNELRADHTRKSQELSALKKAGEEDDDEDGEDKGKKSDAKGEEAIRNRVLDAGITEQEIEQWSTEFWTNDTISDATYAKLEEKGFSRTMVDQFAAGQRALYQGQTEALYNAGGGRQQVETMMAWAGENMTDGQINSLNAQFASHDPNTQMLAMETLRLRYEAANGRPATRSAATGGVAQTSGSVYTSIAQVQMDMSDPRYKTDPAYRNAVAEKIARSQVL